MKYYKSETGEVFAYEADGSQDAYIKPQLTQMTEEEIHNHLNPPIPKYVPQSVTMRQARLTLLAAGLLDDVETVLASMEGDEGKAARIEWDYSSEVWRNKPFVISLGTQLGLSDEQLDNLFIEAAKID